MLHRLKKLHGMTLGATDGDIGKVKDVYFDDVSWGVRYLVVDTGGWLSNRKVLISPRAIHSVDWDEETIYVALSQQQVKDSPDIDTDQPVSRQQEAEFYAYYGYPTYWGGGFLWGPYPILADDMAGSSVVAAELALRDKHRFEGDHHLRSADEVTGYHVRAGDEQVGHLEEFLLDDEAWAIRYAVVDTAKWWVGRKVVVRPQWITKVEWADHTASLGLDKAAIEASPEYDPDLTLSRDYEMRLHEHYRREVYWDGE
ncbi:PRC-barrel domain-containing protein [Uliginosibacterium sp. H3]|uniref:PRC-barrel domain-containing protein n=1 Tax=Uliginosibacterium silvisoli TaxID=3114758 RepID=A0ABU6K5Z0_9RHOO|nr:PRC-barrel domain-containing protein [Uliginosibacterium sp. H3]